MKSFSFPPPLRSNPKNLTDIWVQVVAKQALPYIKNGMSPREAVLLVLLEKQESSDYLLPSKIPGNRYEILRDMEWKVQTVVERAKIS